MRRLVPLLALATLTVGVERADACTCSDPGPACQAAWNVDGLFVGQVIGFESIASGPTRRNGFLVETQDARVRIRVRVLESFRGVSGEETIVLGEGGTCGFGFTVGETYLIYAAWDARNGGWATSICMRTRRIDRAAEDLAYLRARAPRPSGRGVLTGTALRGDPAQAAAPVPWPGLRVTARSGDRQYEAVTGRDGRYEIAAPPAAYELTFEVPDGLWVLPGSGARTVLRDASACAVVDVRVQSDGRITGRVIDPAGRPVGGLEVTARERHSSLFAIAITGGDGAYELMRIAPGEYAIEAMKRFYPGTAVVTEATTVTLGVSQRVAMPDFVLEQGARLATIEGVVRDAQGRPIEGAWVSLVQVSGREKTPRATRTTSARGQFHVAAEAGAIYELSARVAEEGKAREITVAAFELTGDQTIELTVQDR